MPHADRSVRRHAEVIHRLDFATAATTTNARPKFPAIHFVYSVSIVSGVKIDCIHRLWLACRKIGGHTLSVFSRSHGQAGVAVDDCRDGVVPGRPNEPGYQRDTGERQHLGELWNEKPAPANLLAGGSSGARRTNSVFGIRRNRRSRCRAMPPGSRRSE
jgi:hypothetical protein